MEDEIKVSGDVVIPGFQRMISSSLLAQFKLNPANISRDFEAR